MILLLTPDSKYLFEGREEGQDLCIDKNSDWKVVKETWIENVYQINPSDFGDTGIFIDIGANIGAVSVYVASFNNALDVGSKRIKVFAYEPEPHNLSLLSKNIKRNNLVDDIKIIPKAVFSTSPIMISNKGGDSSVLQTLKDSSEVEAVSLESVFANNKIASCDVLKMDVEGAEYDILLNTDIEILRKIKYLALEFHCGHNREFGKVVAKLAEVFNLHILGTPSRGGYIYGRRY